MSKKKKLDKSYLLVTRSSACLADQRQMFKKSKQKKKEKDWRVIIHFILADLQWLSMIMPLACGNAR